MFDVQSSSWLVASGAVEDSQILGSLHPHGSPHRSFSPINLDWHSSSHFSVIHINKWECHRKWVQEGMPIYTPRNFIHHWRQPVLIQQIEHGSDLAHQPWATIYRHFCASQQCEAQGQESWSAAAQPGAHGPVPWAWASPVAALLQPTWPEESRIHKRTTWNTRLFLETCAESAHPWGPGKVQALLSCTAEACSFPTHSTHLQAKGSWQMGQVILLAM